MRNSHNHSISLRFISGLTLIFFLMTQGVCPPGYASTSPAKTKPVQAIENALKTLPQSFGHISDLWISSQSKHPFVLIVQDAHGQMEAQKNTERLFEFLDQKIALSAFFIEGGTGILDPEKLRLFRETSMNLAAAKWFLKEGDLGGVELFLLKKAGVTKKQTKQRKRLVMGVEDQKLYVENLSLFEKVAEQKAVTDAWLSQRLLSLEKKASQAFNPELLRFFKAWQAFEDVPNHFERYLTALDEAAANHGGVQLRDASNQQTWPMLVRLTELKRRQARLNYEEASDEAVRLLEWAQSKGIGESLFLSHLKNLSNTNRSASLDDLRSQWESFYAIAKSFGFDFEQYPALTLWEGARILESEMDANQLMAEADRLRDLILERLALKPEEKDVIKAYQDYLLLQKLFQLRLDRAEFEKITRSSPDLLLKEDSFPELSEIQGVFNSAIQFYQMAIAREEPMAQILFQSGQKHRVEVFVSGGFHTPAIIQKLREADYSYAVISPHMSQVEGEARYWNSIVSNNPLFAPPSLKPVSLGTALSVSHIRAANLLAEWRGQLPREMSERRMRMFSSIRQAGHRVGAEWVGQEKLKAGRDVSSSAFLRSEVRVEAEKLENPKMVTLVLGPDQKAENLLTALARESVAEPFALRMVPESNAQKEELLGLDFVLFEALPDWKQTLMDALKRGNVESMTQNGFGLMLLLKTPSVISKAGLVSTVYLQFTAGKSFSRMSNGFQSFVNDVKKRTDPNAIQSFRSGLDSMDMNVYGLPDTDRVDAIAELFSLPRDKFLDEKSYPEAEEAYAKQLLAKAAAETVKTQTTEEPAVELVEKTVGSVGGVAEVLGTRGTQATEAAGGVGVGELPSQSPVEALPVKEATLLPEATEKADRQVKDALRKKAAEFFNLSRTPQQILDAVKIPAGSLLVGQLNRIYFEPFESVPLKAFAKQPQESKPVIESSDTVIPLYFSNTGNFSLEQLRHLLQTQSNFGERKELASERLYGTVDPSGLLRVYQLKPMPERTDLPKDSRGFLEKMNARTFVQAVQEKILGGEFNITKSTIQNAGLRKKQAHQWAAWLEQVTAEFSGESLSAGVMAVIRKHFSVQIRRFETMEFADPGNQDAAIAQIRVLAGNNPNALRSYERSVSKTYNAKSKKFNADLDAMDNGFRSLVNQAALFASELLASVIQEEFLESVQLGALSTEVSSLKPQAVQAAAADSQKPSAVTLAPETLEAAAAERLQQMKRETVQKKGQWSEQDDEVFRQFFLEWAKHAFAEKGKMPNFPATRNTWQAIKKKEMEEKAARERAQNERVDARAAIENFIWKSVEENQRQENSRWQKLGDEAGVRDYARTVWISETMVDQYLTSPETARSYPEPTEFRKAMTAYLIEHSPQALLEFQVDEVLEKLQKTDVHDLSAIQGLLTRVNEFLSQPLVASQRQVLENQSRELLNRAVDQTRQAVVRVMQRITVPKETIAASERDDLRELLRVSLRMVRQASDDVFTAQLEADQHVLELGFALLDEIERLSAFAKSGDFQTSEAVQTVWTQGVSLRGELKAAGEAVGLQVLDETLGSVAEAYAVALVTASQAAAEGGEAAELGKLIEAKTMLLHEDGRLFAEAIRLLDEEINSVQQKLKKRAVAEERTKQQKEIDDRVSRRKEIEVLLKTAKPDAATAASLLAAPELKAELTDRILVEWLTALSQEAADADTPEVLPKTGKVISYLTSALQKQATADLKRQLFAAILNMAKARSEMRTGHEELEEDREIARLRTVEMLGVSTQIPRGLFVRDGEQEGFITEQTLPLGLEEYTVNRSGRIEAYRIAGEVEVKGDRLPVYAMDYSPVLAWQELASLADPENTLLDITITGLVEKTAEDTGQKRVNGFYVDYKGQRGFVPFSAKPAHLNFGGTDLEEWQTVVGRSFKAVFKNFGSLGDNPIFYISEPPTREDIQIIEKAAQGTSFEVLVTGIIHPNHDLAYEPSGLSAEWNGVHIFIPGYLVPREWKKDLNNKVGEIISAYAFNSRDRIYSFAVPGESTGAAVRDFPFLRKGQAEMLHVKWLTHKRRADGSHEVTGLRVTWNEGAYEGYVPLDQIPSLRVKELSEAHLKQLVGQSFTGNFLRLMGGRPGFMLEPPPSVTVAMVRLRSYLMLRAAETFAREAMERSDRSGAAAVKTGESFAVLDRRVQESIDVLEKTGKADFLDSSKRLLSRWIGDASDPEIVKILTGYRERIDAIVQMLHYDHAFLENLKLESSFEMTVGQKGQLQFVLGGKPIEVAITAGDLLPEANGDLKLNLAFDAAAPLIINPRKDWLSGEKYFVLDSGQVNQSALLQEHDREKTGAEYHAGIRSYAGQKIIVHDVYSGDEVVLSILAIQGDGKVLFGISQNDFKTREVRFNAIRSEVRQPNQVKDRTLHVGVNPDMSYEVKMSDNLFSPDNPLLNKEIKKRKVLVVADVNIGKAKLKAIRDYLKHFGITFKVMTLPGGEQVKDGEEGLANVIKIMKSAEDAGLSRKDLMILVGGGAVLDVGGFAASIAHRGIPHVRVPTTLLAQVDAGIGVKNSINFFGQKNFVGAFRPPQSVLVDPAFLNALNIRQMRSGMAEAIKVSLMKDADYFRLIEEHGADLISRDFSPQSRARDIMWLSIVRHLEQIHTDPFETKLARPLDYGHEWGHRLESVTHHTITHGEGVAIGTAIDTVISWQRGYISKKQLDRVLKVIEQSGLPLFHPDAKVENLWPGLESFRRHLGGKLTISLLGKIGQKRDTHRMEMSELGKALDYLSGIHEGISRSEVRAKSGHEKRKQQSKIRAHKEAVQEQSDKRRMAGLVIAVSMGGGLLFDMLVLGMSPLDPEIPLQKFFVTYFLTAAGIALAALVPQSIPFWIAQWRAGEAQWIRQMQRMEERAERRKQQAAERHQAQVREAALRAEAEANLSEAQTPEPVREEIPQVVKSPLERAVSRMEVKVRTQLQGLVATARRKNVSRNVESVLIDFKTSVEEALTQAAGESKLDAEDEAKLRQQFEPALQKLKHSIESWLTELKTKETAVYTIKRDRETARFLNTLVPYVESAQNFAWNLMAQDTNRLFPYEESLAFFDHHAAAEKERLLARLKLTEKDAETVDRQVAEVKKGLRQKLDADKQVVEDAREAKRIFEEAEAARVRAFQDAKTAIIDYLWNRIVTKGHTAKFGSEAEVRSFAQSWFTDEKVESYQEDSRAFISKFRFVDFKNAWEAHVKARDPRYQLEQRIRLAVNSLEQVPPDQMDRVSEALHEAASILKTELSLETSQIKRLRGAVEKILGSSIDSIVRVLKPVLNSSERVSDEISARLVRIEDLLAELRTEGWNALDGAADRIQNLKSQIGDHRETLVLSQSAEMELQVLAAVDVSNPDEVFAVLKRSAELQQNPKLLEALEMRIREEREALFDRWADHMDENIQLAKQQLENEERDPADLPALDLAQKADSLDEFSQRLELLKNAAEEMQRTAEIMAWIKSIDLLIQNIDEEDLQDVQRALQQSEELSDISESLKSKVDERLQQLITVFSGKLGEMALDVKEGSEEDFADAIHESIKVLGVYLQDRTLVWMKDARDAETLLRETAVQRKKAVAARKLEDKAAADKERNQTLADWLKNPVPVDEAAQFFLKEPSLQELIANEGTIRKFLEQAAKGNMAQRVDSLRTYLGINEKGTKMVTNSPSDKVYGQDRRFIETLGKMATAVRSEVRTKKLTLTGLRKTIKDLGYGDSLYAGELAGEFAVSPIDEHHLQGIDEKLSSVEHAILREYPESRVVWVDARRTGDRDDVRIEIKTNVKRRSEIRENVFFEDQPVSLETKILYRSLLPRLPEQVTWHSAPLPLYGPLPTGLSEGAHVFVFRNDGVLMLRWIEGGSVSKQTALLRIMYTPEKNELSVETGMLESSGLETELADYRSFAAPTFVLWMDHYLVPFAKSLDVGTLRFVRGAVAASDLQALNFVEGEQHVWLRDLSTEQTKAFKTLKQRFAEALHRAVLMTGGNRKEAAKLLGVGERTLYRLIERYPAMAGEKSLSQGGQAAQTFDEIEQRAIEEALRIYGTHPTVDENYRAAAQALGLSIRTFYRRMASHKKARSEVRTQSSSQFTSPVQTQSLDEWLEQLKSARRAEGIPLSQLRDIIWRLHEDSRDAEFSWQLDQPFQLGESLGQDSIFLFGDKSGAKLIQMKLETFIETFKQAMALLPQAIRAGVLVEQLVSFRREDNPDGKTGRLITRYSADSASEMLRRIEGLISNRVSVEINVNGQKIDRSKVRSIKIDLAYGIEKESSTGLWIVHKYAPNPPFPARSEVRSLPADWTPLEASDLFSSEEQNLFDWRMSYLDGLWPRWDEPAKQMLLTPSFLLMLLGAKPGYISTTSAESLPAKFFGVANERFRNDLGYGLFNDDLQSPIAFSLKESIQSVYENEVYFREQGLPLSDEDILGLAVLSKHPYWNWQDEHILFARKILSDLFADAVKQDRTWDIFMGLIAGYPANDVKEYVRINGRELGHERVLENFMDYRHTEFANVFFLSRKEGSLEADRQKARFRAALYYAYAGLRHHSDFTKIAGQINLPESVHTAPAPSSILRSEVRAQSPDQLDPQFKRWVVSARLLIRNHGTYIFQLPSTSTLNTPERMKAGKLLLDLSHILGRMRIVPIPAGGKAGLSADFKNPTVYVHGPEDRGTYSLETVARALIRSALTYREFKKITDFEKLTDDEKRTKTTQFAIEADMAVAQVRKRIGGTDRDFALLDDLIDEQVIGWLDPDGSLFAAAKARQGDIDAAGLAEYQAAIRSGTLQPTLPQSMKVYFALLQMDFSEHHDLEKLGQSTSGFELELTEALNTQVLPDQKDPVPEMLAGLVNAMSSLIRKEKVPTEESMQILMDQKLVHLLAKQVIEAMRIYILSQYWQGDDLFELQGRLAETFLKIDPSLELYSFLRHDFLLEEISAGINAADISREAAERLQGEIQVGKRGTASALGTAMAQALRLTSEAAATSRTLRLGGGQTLLIAGPSGSEAAPSPVGNPAVSSTAAGRADETSVPLAPSVTRVLDLTKRPVFPDSVGYSLSGQILIANMEKLLSAMVSEKGPVTAEYFVANYPSDWTANLETAFRRLEANTVTHLEELKNVIIFMMHLYHFDASQGTVRQKKTKALAGKWAAAGNKIGGVFSDEELDRLVAQLGAQKRVGGKKGGVYSKEQIRVASFIALGLITHLTRLQKRDDAEMKMGDERLAVKARANYAKALGELAHETGDNFFAYVVANLQVVEQVLKQQKVTPTAQPKSPAAAVSTPLSADESAVSGEAPATAETAPKKKSLWSVMGDAVTGRKEEKAATPVEPAKPTYSMEPTFEGFLMRVEKIAKTVRAHVERKTLKEAVHAVKILFGGSGSDDDFKKGYKSIQRETHSDLYQGREEINKASSEIFGMINGDTVVQKDLLQALDRLIESAASYLKGLSAEDRAKVAEKAPAPKTTAGEEPATVSSSRLESLLVEILAEVKRGNGLLEQLVQAAGHTPVAGPAGAAASAVAAGESTQTTVPEMADPIKKDIENLIGRLLSLRRDFESLQSKYDGLKEQKAIFDIAVGMTLTGTDKAAELDSILSRLPGWLNETLTMEAYGQLDTSKEPAEILKVKYDAFNQVLREAELALPVFKQLIEGLESAWPMAATMASAKSEVRKPSPPVRSEVRISETGQVESVVAVARRMTAKIVRLSDLRPEILAKLFPLALRQPEAKLPETERQWILRFYTALFKQGSSIILPAALLRQVSTDAQRDYLNLLILAAQTASLDSRFTIHDPLIHIADDQNNELKNLFFSPENWRANPTMGVDASRAVKFWREPESFVAGRLEKQKTRYAAAVTKPTALRSRAFLVKPEEVRKLTRIKRVIFQARLTQLLQAASTLNEEEFAQLSRELGLHYQIGEAIALNPSAILSSVFAERMNAVLIAKSA